MNYTEYFGNKRTSAGTTRDEQKKYYDEQAAKQIDRANLTYAANEEFLKNTRDTAYGQAESTYQRSVVDSQNSYRANMPGYGATAEQLASAGLTGSGYSEYLASKAYTQHRSEVQSAGAQRDASKKEADLSYATNIFGAQQTRDSAIAQAEQWQAEGKQSADLKYSENMDLINDNEFAHGQTMKDNFTSILAGIGAGTYDDDTDEGLTAVLKSEGYDDARISEALQTKAARNTAIEKTKTENIDILYAQALVDIESGTYDNVTDETMKRVFLANGFTEEQAGALISHRTTYKSNYNKNAVSEQIQSGEITTPAEIDQSAMKPEEKTEAKEELKDITINTINNYIGSGDYDSAATALDQAYANGVITEKVYQERYHTLFMKKAPYSNNNLSDIAGFVNEVYEFNGEIQLEDGSTLKRLTDTSYKRLLVAARTNFKTVAGLTQSEINDLCYTAKAGLIGPILTLNLGKSIEALTEEENTAMKKLFGNMTSGAVLSLGNNYYIKGGKGENASWYRVKDKEKLMSIIGGDEK